MPLCGFWFLPAFPYLRLQFPSAPNIDTGFIHKKCWKRNTVSIRSWYSEHIGRGRRTVEQQKDPCIKEQPEASLDTVRGNLAVLKQLTAESTAIASGIEQVVQKLKAPMQEQGAVFTAIDDNFAYLNDIISTDMGLVQGKYTILEGKIQAGAVYIESLADKNLIGSQVIEPLLLGEADSSTAIDEIPMLLQSKFISIPGTQPTVSMKQVLLSLLDGELILFIEGANSALIINSRRVDKRSIDKPENEGTVLASLDSFTEDLATNCSMIIKRLPTPALRFSTFCVGILSRTKVKLLWIEGIANAKIVTEARRRITEINIDNIYGVGMLAELLEDNPLSIFPKYRQTERPDSTAKYLTDGHIAILCDNSPFAVLAPITLWDNFKTMDDYAESRTSASYLRIARYIAFLSSILLAPVYLAFVAYNQNIVPQPLGLAIATGRAGAPFPSVVELLIMTLAITIIREAALRISGSVGVFIGTLAAVVIGQAIVAAGYISASIIIVVAVSEISAFAISTTTVIYTSRLINYFFIALAGMFGMFGLINGITIVFWHLASLESFGVPYLYPLAPFELSAMRDTFIRFGVLQKRFSILAPINRTRTAKKDTVKQ